MLLTPVFFGHSRSFLCTERRKRERSGSGIGQDTENISVLFRDTSPARCVSHSYKLNYFHQHPPEHIVTMGVKSTIWESWRISSQSVTHSDI